MQQMNLLKRERERERERGKGTCNNTSLLSHRPLTKILTQHHGVLVALHREVKPESERALFLVTF